jgi:MFS family permease
MRTVAIAFAISMAFTTLPTPLWPLYEHSDGLSTTSVTLAFSAYAIGVLISLFLGGHLSDWMGRRTILIPAIVAEAISAVIFIVWHPLPGLFVARLLSGLAIGLVTATATAALVDLHGRSGDGHPRRADQLATAANLGGLGLGPIISGFVARWLPAPLITGYAIFLGLLIVAAILVLLTPETVEIHRRRYRPQRVSVPQHARSRYLLLGVTGFISFALFGLFTSLSSKILASALGVTSLVISGLVSGLVFLLAVVAQLFSGGLSNSRQVQLGLAALAVGFALLLISGLGSWFAPFLAGAVFGGIGAGLAFRGAMAGARELADAAVRGEVIAGIFLAAYLGLVVPIVGLGIATHVISLETGLAGFSAVLLVILALTALGLRRTRVPAGQPI